MSVDQHQEKADREAEKSFKTDSEKELWIEIDVSNNPTPNSSLLPSPTVIIEKRLGSPVDPSDFDIWTPTRHQQSARKQQRQFNAT